MWLSSTHVRVTGDLVTMQRLVKAWNLYFPQVPCGELMLLVYAPDFMSEDRGGILCIGHLFTTNTRLYMCAIILILQTRKLGRGQLSCPASRWGLGSEFSLTLVFFC